MNEFQTKEVNHNVKKETGQQPGNSNEKFQLNTIEDAKKGLKSEDENIKKEAENFVVDRLQERHDGEDFKSIDITEEDLEDLKSLEIDNINNFFAKAIVKNEFKSEYKKLEKLKEAEINADKLKEKWDSISKGIFTGENIANSRGLTVLRDFVFRYGANQVSLGEFEKKIMNCENVENIEDMLNLCNLYEDIIGGMSDYIENSSDKEKTIKELTVEADDIYDNYKDGKKRSEAFKKMLSEIGIDVWSDTFKNFYDNSENNFFKLKSIDSVSSDEYQKEIEKKMELQLDKLNNDESFKKSIKEKIDKKELDIFKENNPQLHDIEEKQDRVRRISSKLEGFLGSLHEVKENQEQIQEFFDSGNLDIVYKKDGRDEYYSIDINIEVQQKPFRNKNERIDDEINSLEEKRKVMKKPNFFEKLFGGQKKYDDEIKKIDEEIKNKKAERSKNETERAELYYNAKKWEDKLRKLINSVNFKDNKFEIDDNKDIKSIIDQVGKRQKELRSVELNTEEKKLLEEYERLKAKIK